MPLAVLTRIAPDDFDDEPTARANLRRAADISDFRRALSHGSPAIEDAIRRWDEGVLSKKGERSLMAALARYLARATGRATPFDFFGSTTSVSIAGGTRLFLANTSRSDGDLTSLKVFELNKIDPLVRANPTIFQDGQSIRYVLTDAPSPRVVCVRAKDSIRKSLSLARLPIASASFHDAAVGSGLSTTDTDGLLSAGLLTYARPTAADREMSLAPTSQYRDSAGAGQISSSLVSKVMRAGQVLHTLFAPPDDGLRPLREEFYAEYGDEQVPLCRVADPDLGLRSLRRPLVSLLPSARTATDNPLLVRSALEAIAAGKFLNISDQILSVSGPSLPLPNAVALRFRLLESSQCGRSAELIDLSGPASMRFTARTAAIHSVLGSDLQEWALLEQNKESALICEIVYWPRKGRPEVALRPNLGPEIDCGTGCRFPLNALPANDLLVSVSDDEIILRSRSMGGRLIRPRLTSTHNPLHEGTNVYRLLWLISRQRCSPEIKWRWGVLESAPQLPEVRFGDVLLAPRRWRLSAREHKRLGDSTQAVYSKELRTILVSAGAPRLLRLRSGDESLLCDVKNPLSLLATRKVLKKAPSATFEQVFDEFSSVRDAESGDPLVHEVIVPLRRTSPKRSSAPYTLRHFRVARNPPGGEWLYVQFASGIRTLDRFISGDLASWLTRLNDCEFRNSVFFVRYSSPRNHVRIRVRLGCPSDAFEHLLRFRGWAIKHNLKMSLHEYVRETDCYGGPRLMAQVEELFGMDSRHIGRFFHAIGSEPSSSYREELALRRMRDAWNAFIGREGDIEEKPLRSLSFLSQSSVITADIKEWRAALIAQRGRTPHPARRHFGERIAHLCANRLLLPPARSVEGELWKVILGPRDS